MNVARVLLLAIVMMSVSPVFADRARYGGKKDLTAQSSTLTVRHRHDWSLVLEQLKFSLDNPFGVEPSVSGLEFFEHGKSVARVPSPPLTYLYITPDSRYVVGLSNIKAMNDVQLAVFDRNAKLLLHRHISARVYEVSAEAYQQLRVKHAEAFAEFDKVYRYTRTSYAWREGNIVYLDLWYGVTEPGWSRLINDVFPGMRESPYSPNFSGSVTNWINWYHEADPAPRIVERDGRPELIELRDPEGIEMSIPFRLTPAHGGRP